MLSATALAIAIVATLQRDTTVLLGTVDRDLTGDGKAEALRLVGAGRSVDSMQFTVADSAITHKPDWVYFSRDPQRGIRWARIGHKF